MSDFTEYADLGATGFKSVEQVKPEDEFFHSLYIAGQTRTNHIGVVEQPGKLQVRGVEYNLNQAHMIIVHVKKVLVKNGKNHEGKDVVQCFSFKKEPNPPWFGWNNRPCGSNSNERASNSFCNTCREQIILTGLYCDPAGNPVLHSETKKPLFVFLRGKGMKYNNVSTYLTECYKEEITTPLFVPASTESTNFEKIHVNNKRFVTIVGIDKVPSKYGDKDVFTFTKGNKLDHAVIKSVLDIAKKSMDKFNEKFDWTKTDTTSGYTPDMTPAAVNPTNIIPETNVGGAKSQPQQPTQQQVTPQPTFNFEDINF